MSRSDRERLELFCVCVDRVLARRGVTEQTIAAEYRECAGPEGTLQTDCDLGDEEHLRAMLPDLRKFFAPGDDVSFFGIAKIIERRTTDEQLKDDGRWLREAWKDVVCSGWMHLVIGDKTYKAEDCFDLVLNGEIFHNDRAKAQILADLDDGTRIAVSVVVNSLVMNAVHVLRVQRGLVAEILVRDALAP